MSTKSQCLIDESCTLHQFIGGGMLRHFLAVGLLALRVSFCMLNSSVWDSQVQGYIPFCHLPKQCFP